MSDLPQPPFDELRDALGDHPTGNAALDELHAALDQEKAPAHKVHGIVDRLRAIPVIEARILDWWEDPATQRWVMNLSNSGL
jgi:hypothetical protein